MGTMVEFLAGMGELPVSDFKPGLANNSLVKYLILDSGISSYGKSLVAKEEEFKKDTADKLGIDYQEPIYNIKNCGLEYKVAVVGIYNSATQQFDSLLGDDGSLPDFNIFGKIDQLPIGLALKKFREPESKLAWTFKKYFEAGVDAPNKAEGVIHTFFMPFMPMEAKSEKAENRRKDEEIKNLNAINVLPEEQITEFNRAMIGRRLLLHKVNKSGKVVYYLPEKGMYSFANAKVNGFYYELNAFGFNKETRSTEIYVNGHQCIDSTEESIKLADTLVELNEKAREEYLEKKNNPVDKVAEEAPIEDEW
jgi:hypothetical protein